MFRSTTATPRLGQVLRQLPKQRGQLKDPYRNTHNPNGSILSFSLQLEQVDSILVHISTGLTHLRCGCKSFSFRVTFSRLRCI